MTSTLSDRLDDAERALDEIAPTCAWPFRRLARYARRKIHEAQRDLATKGDTEVPICSYDGCEAEATETVAVEFRSPTDDDEVGRGALELCARHYDILHHTSLDRISLG